MNIERPSRQRDDVASDAHRSATTGFRPSLRGLLVVGAIALALGLPVGWLASTVTESADAPTTTANPAVAVPDGQLSKLPDAAAAGAATTTTGATAEISAIDVYTRDDCPHCADARAYLDALVAERPEITVRYRDMLSDADCRLALAEIAATRGLDAVSAPVIVIGESVIVDFVDAETTGAQILSALSGETIKTSDGFGGCAAPPRRK